MRFFRITALLVLALLGQTGAVFAGTSEPTLPHQLTLADALRVFRQHGIDLLIAAAQVASARADAKIAGAVANPTVSGSVGPTFGYTPPPGCSGCSNIAWGVGLSDQAALFDSISGKRSLRKEVAAAALKAANESRADAQRQLEYQLKNQYLLTVLARDTLDFSREVLQTVTRTFELTQLRFRAGAIAEADVAKVETAKLEAEQTLDRAEQDLETAKAQLAFLLGVRGQMPDFEVDSDLPKFAVPAPLEQATVNSLLKVGYDHRPDLRAAGFQIERAERSRTASRRSRLPDITLSAQFQAEGFDSNSITPPTLTFGLSLPIPIFYRYAGEVAKSEADLRLQQLGRSKVEASMLAEVHAAFHIFSQTRHRVERMEARLLERSRRARDLIQLQYQKGAASLLEFLDAQRTFIATNEEYLTDLSDYWSAVYQVEAAVGTELR